MINDQPLVKPFSHVLPYDLQCTLLGYHPSLGGQNPFEPEAAIRSARNSRLQA
jgi:hypothetical protein